MRCNLHNVSDAVCRAGQPPSIPSVLDEPLIDTETRAFLEDFRAHHGRAPRILHVGNIANNAYLNAKLLNEYGFDCDVLCYDYYHVMGCPEWADAAFEGDIGDQFYPRWWSVDLKGYRRPRWFAQGPLRAAVRYLVDRRAGRHLKAEIRWHWLSFERFQVCSRAAESQRSATMLSARIAAETALLYAIRAVRQALSSIPLLVKSIGRIINALLSLVMSLTIILTLVMQVPCLILGIRCWMPTRSYWKSIFYRRPQSVSESKGPQGVADHLSLARSRVAEFLSRFPNHYPPLTVSDFSSPVFANRAAEMERLFPYYDVVQCYATDPIFGLFVDRVPIVAFEHGTIREIPFEDTSTGRLTLLAYAKASAVVLTNADNLQRARQIRPDWERIVPGLHGFDERPITQLVSEIGLTPDISLRFGFDRSIRVLLAPARHDHFVKGNDRLIEAIALARAKYRGLFKVVFVAWGNDVEKSKALIAQLGISDTVHWVAPMHAKTLVKAYTTVDCVIDQFLLPCFGAIPLEVMSVGRCPVMTYIDDQIVQEYYGETLPVLNCNTVEQIAAGIGTVVDDPEHCSQLTLQARQWMELHHTHKHVVYWLVQAYRLAGILEPGNGVT